MSICAEYGSSLPEVLVSVGRSICGVAWLWSALRMSKTVGSMARLKVQGDGGPRVEDDDNDWSWGGRLLKVFLGGRPRRLDGLEVI